MRFARSVLLFAAAASFLAAGCGGPSFCDVTGVVTRGGQPVKNLQVMFLPEKGRPSSGISDDQGRYQLQYTDQQKGLMPGKYKVVVEYVPPTMDEQVALQQGTGAYPPGIKEILAKYGNRNQPALQLDVEKGKQIDLQLD